MYFRATRFTLHYTTIYLSCSIAKVLSTNIYFHEVSQKNKSVLLEIVTMIDYGSKWWWSIRNRNLLASRKSLWFPNIVDGINYLPLDGRNPRNVWPYWTDNQTWYRRHYQKTLSALALIYCGNPHDTSMYYEY